MTSRANGTDDRAGTRRRAVAAMTFATGVIVANNYYAQPLEDALAEAFHATSSQVGVVLTLIQLGYAFGLATIVPLGDLLERRKLVVTMLSMTVAGMVVVAIAPSLTVLGAAATLVGLTTVAAQVLVPFAAHLAPEGQQGKTISTVMSGLLIGVLVSRVVAGLVSQALGWRAVFVLGAVLTAVAVILLWRTLPVLPPATKMHYFALLRSVVSLVREEPVLRWRVVYSATSYAAFSALWTSIGFMLAAPPHNFEQGAIGLFALFGVAGAAAARFAGRLADRGWAHHAVGGFLLVSTLAWLLIGQGARPGAGAVVALAIGLLLFDLGVQGVHVSNQAIVYALRPEARSRLNSAYMTLYFLGGAVGSGLSAAAYASNGWLGVSVLGGVLPAIGLAFWLVDTAFRRRRARVGARAVSVAAPATRA
ncbi:MFS transporter [Pseudonocardia sp. CA-142604]|uniref:MFS transporter n=1 Tax=Pseudonocardia sp. CA-142604 TaxID=3240024 RepID=UPI003D8FC6E4